MKTLDTENPGPARQVLVVDDEPAMRAALEVSFARGGWKVESAAGKADALARLRLRHPALVVTDVRMPDGSGFEVMRAARELSPQAAVILLTAFGAVPDAVAAIKSGACEYLVKPVPLEQLLESAKRVCTQGNSSPAGDMVGSSPVLLDALAQARQAARSDADVLIEAESGTGKELLARMIHALSSRRDRAFVAVNCAGFPEPLLESELFGHARGAFTGAEAAHSGKFQLADGGTLLLDEIGELPLSLQPKLLRALQEREFYRLGESTPVKVDIRVIASTNRSLGAMVSEGGFRADLYYRLNVIPLSLPPLRERREDIRELAQHFARKFSPTGMPAELPGPLLEEFERCNWPGNVRELANVVQRTLALGSAAPEPRPANLNMPLLPAKEVANLASPDSFPSAPMNGLCSGMSWHDAQRRLFEMTLASTGGNRSRAAEMLGVSLRTVRNKVREYKLPARRQYAHGNPLSNALNNVLNNALNND